MVMERWGSGPFSDLPLPYLLSGDLGRFTRDGPENKVDEDSSVVEDRRDKEAVDRLLSSPLVKGLAEAAINELAPAGETLLFYQQLIADRTDTAVSDAAITHRQQTSKDA